ncbi:MAG: DUF92 domain-containing protein [Armatimonadaceae bacterium]
MPEVPSLSYLAIALLAALTIAGLALRVRALSRSGAAAAAFIGFSLFGFGKWQGAAALLLFFVSSSLLSRFGKARKEAMHFEKGSERDAGQVFANAGAAALLALALPFVYPNEWLIAATLGALATANADTWATEIGSLSRGQPRIITNFQPAPPGASGAISVNGTLAALAGAVLLAFMAFAWGGDAGTFVAVALGGFVGSLLDSLLGATIQIQYRCPVCGKVLETTEHCGTPTSPFRGYKFFNNDIINLAATILGGVLSAVLSQIF